MIRRLTLALPWLFLALVLGMIAWDQLRVRSAGVSGVTRDPVCGMEVRRAVAPSADHGGATWYFCAPECRAQFVADPGAWLRPEVARDAARDGHLMRGLPTWMYQVGVAFVLLLSFGLFEAIGRGKAAPAAQAKGSMALGRRECLASSRPGDGGTPGLNGSSPLDFAGRLGGLELTARAEGPALPLPWDRPAPAAHAGPGQGMPRDGRGPAVARAHTGPALIDLSWANRILRWAPLQTIARAVFVVFFLVIVAAGLFGNQNPAMNIAPLLTWTIWWAGLVFLVLYAGKAWCWVCPWDAVATWMERLSFRSPRRSGLGLGLKWPRWGRNIWFAVGLFVLLTWIELGMGITMIPRATAWVALGMLGLSVASAFLFERKSFCRYGCLVGRVSGLYALFSPIELRAASPDACADCKTADCFRGNERGDGCPTFEFPRVMKLNTYCILCTECVRTCPHDNVGLRLRPWAADLVREGKPRVDEAFLAVILLAMTGFHGLTMTPSWPAWVAATREAIGGGEATAFSLLMAAMMAVPILLFWGLSRLAAIWTTPHRTGKLFVAYAYALLPIALFYHLAHNAEHFLMEGPKVLALASDPFGWGWNLFGTARWSMPPLITLEGLWVIQVLMVLVGHVYSLWISERTARRLVPERRRAFLGQMPILAAMVLFSVYSLWLLKQPMEMRSAM